MKKLFFTLLTSFMVTITMAQVPNVINYQAVARNAAGQALANQSIKVRLTISDVTEPTYQETRTVTTNALGLFNIQIGSAGATNVLGVFAETNWLMPGGLTLKVELDVNNSGLFTDMGTQSLATVPFSFASNEVVNINGMPIDRQAVPVAGDRLKFNGSKWTTVKRDTAFMVSGPIAAIFVEAGTPWVFAGPTATVTVTGAETIVASGTASFGHSGANGVLVAYAMCYQNIGGGPVTQFFPDATTTTSATVNPNPNKTPLTTSGCIKLPAGTYRIGFGIANRSISSTLNANDRAMNVIEIKY